MKTTWRKAFRRLVRRNSEARATAWPAVYRYIPAKELQEVVAQGWAEIQDKLSAVPVGVGDSAKECPPGRRAFLVRAIRAYVFA